ncbi:MlaD family protein [bacterium]|jgi:phospholipid/cholesterol/gamma-HCH transport system substrate-binding protein|nr:MlaD family protein [bacterium]
MQDNRLEFKVGLFVLIGLLVLAFMILKLGNKEFKETYRVIGVFDFTGGVIKGAPVRCSGVEMGKVVDLVLKTENLTEGETSHVEVVMEVAQGVILREDARVSIQSYGILGEKHIEFTPVSQTARILKPNDKIIGINPVMFDDLAKEGQKIFKSINNAANGIEKLLTDQNVKNLSDTFSNTKNLTMEMRQFICRLDSLLENNEQNITKMIEGFKADAEKLENSIDNLNDILVSIKEGNGTAGKLVVDAELYNELTGLIKDLREHGLFYKAGKSDKSRRTKSSSEKDDYPDTNELGEGINRGFIR